jgi:hypothetical protein
LSSEHKSLLCLKGKRPYFSIGQEFTSNKVIKDRKEIDTIKKCFVAQKENPISPEKGDTGFMF